VKHPHARLALNYNDFSLGPLPLNKPSDVLK